MDSVEFDGEDEFHPSTSKSKKYKLPRKLLDACSAVNHASAPRKLRSAIKKLGRDSITPPLPISRKQNHVTNEVELLRKDSSKKSKLNMKQGNITKDEKEVAETLYALADMFSDATNSNKPGLDGGPSKEKSTILEAGSSTPAAKDTAILTTQENSGKISTRVTLEIACHSSSSGDALRLTLPFSKQPATANSSYVQSELSLGPRSKMSTLDGIPCGERAIDLNQVVDSRMQNGKHYNAMADKNNCLFLWPSSSSRGAPSFETQGSCLRHPPFFENTNYATQLCKAESKKSWKRCSAHVYISRLVKVLQVSEKMDGMLEKPSQSTSNRGIKLGPHVYINNQKKWINDANSVKSFSVITPYTAEKNSAEIQNVVILNKRLIQDQQLGSKSSGLCSSLEQNSDFLSLAAGGCDLDATGHDHKAPKKIHASCLQSQNHLAMLFPLPQNGYYSTFHGHASSALAAQQVQLPPYPRNTLGSGAASYVGQEVESQQQKWTPQFPSQYNCVGAVVPRILNWQNEGRNSPSLLHYAQALLPHLDASPHLTYQPIL